MHSFSKEQRSEASGWCPVSPQEPCKICGKPDWCSRTSNGCALICRRMGTSAGQRKVARDGSEYWLYSSFEAHHRERSLPQQRVAESPRLEPSILHEVYIELLSSLVLEPVHHEGLISRGLTSEQIFRGRYRSYPLKGRHEIASYLVERFGATVCSLVPGIGQERVRKSRWWKLTGAPGLLVPVRNLLGQIVALKVRSNDRLPGSKYTYLSSKVLGGPGPGAPVHIPIFAQPSRIIRLSEGELKADVASAITGICTLSVPGVTAWQSSFPILAALKPGEVRLAFDSDSRTNRNVGRALASAARSLYSAGYQVRIETWMT
jgi:hypothetical protein